MGVFTLIMSVVAAVAGVIGVGIAAWSLYLHRQRAKQEDTPELQVRISPTVADGRRVVQMFVLNKGRRPVYVDAWFCGTAGHLATSNRVLPTSKDRLPIVLQEQNECNLTFDPSAIGWEQMEKIGVHDRLLNFYEASTENIEQFKRVARDNPPAALEQRPFQGDVT